MDRDTDPTREATRRKVVRMLEQTERRVEDLRRLRNAYDDEGDAREDLDRRLEYCEYLLDLAREDVEEIERDCLILSLSAVPLYRWRPTPLGPGLTLIRGL